MKPYTFAFILLAIGGCSDSNDPIDTHIVILVDQTDSHDILPTIETVAGFTGLDQDPWKGVTATIRTISHVDYTQSVTITLPKENRFLGQADVRRLRIKRFYQNVDSSLTKVTAEPMIGSTSVIFRTCIASLEELAAQDPRQKKLCLIYSNLRENNGGISFYQPETLEKLKRQPQDIQTDLVGNRELPNLSGISAFLIYRPTSSKDNGDYRIISGFYRDILKTAGATVTVGEDRP